MLTALDHIVMTCGDLDATLRFYQEGLEAQVTRFGEGGSRVALQIGAQKINLHVKGREIEPHAAAPMPGAIDLCFLIDMDTADLLAHLDAHRIEIELGPAQRYGAAGEVLSVYMRDPDGNLVELAQQL